MDTRQTKDVPAWMDPLCGLFLYDREEKHTVHHTMFVEDLRVVPMDEAEKLEAEIWEIYNRIGVIVEDGVLMPVDFVDRKTLGYCFIQFCTNQECELAMEKTAQFKLERLPIFADETPGPQENLQKWQPDEKAKARDICVICDDSSTEETMQEDVMDDKASDQFVVHELSCDGANRVNPKLVFKYSETMQKVVMDEKASDKFVVHAGSNSEFLCDEAKREIPEPVFKHSECELDMEKTAQFELERLHIFADDSRENVPTWMDPNFGKFLFGFPLFMGLEMKREVHHTILVEDLRVVPEDESEKLEAEIWAIYRKLGHIVEGGVLVPVNFEKKKTRGHCFIQYSTNQECELAMEKTAQYKLERLSIFADKTPGEKLQICLPDEKAKSRDDSVIFNHSSTEATMEEVVMNVKASDQFVVHAGSGTELLCDDANSENLPKLHADVKARDQFLIHAGSEIEVFLNDAKRGKPELLCSGPENRPRPQFFRSSRPRPRPQFFRSSRPEPNEEKEETAKKKLRQVMRKRKHTKQKQPNLMKNMMEKVAFGRKLVSAKLTCICV